MSRRAIAVLCWLDVCREINPFDYDPISQWRSEWDEITESIQPVLKVNPRGFWVVTEDASRSPNRTRTKFENCADTFFFFFFMRCTTDSARTWHCGAERQTVHRTIVREIVHWELYAGDIGDFLIANNTSIDYVLWISSSNIRVPGYYVVFWSL